MVTPVDYSYYKSKSIPYGNTETNIKFIEKTMKPTKRKINCSNLQFRSTSAFGIDKDHCLCKVLKPVIILWQISGIIPVGHDRQNCKMKHSWFSFLALINFTWIVGNVIGIYLAIPIGKSIIYDDLNGIDSYVFLIVMTVQFASTMLIFLSGNCNAADFLKAWSQLHTTVEEIAMPNFQRVKLLIYLLPLYLTQEIFVNMGIFSWITFSEGIKMNEMPIASQLGSLSSNFIPNLVTGVYAVFICIVTQNFKTINKNLENILQTQSTDVVNIGKYWNPLLPLQIARYRLLHDKLCQSVHLLENSFGIKIMAVFIATCISFVTGIYGLIIGTQGLASAKINPLIIGFGLSTIISAGRVVFVILFCQNVMNEANRTADILNNFNTEACSEDVNIQVGKFLQKLGHFPLQTKCCNVFLLGNSFFASATSTVVTYVLILLQFRIGASTD